jgi:hypothetical protein
MPPKNSGAVKDLEWILEYFLIPFLKKETYLDE